MRKIQLYLPENIYAEFELMAEQKNVPISSTIREYLKTTLEKSNTGINTLINLSKYQLKGGKNLSSNIDNIVYK